MIDYLRRHDPAFQAETRHLIDQENHDNLDKLIEMLSTDQSHEMLLSFIQENETNANFSSWWQYIALVGSNTAKIH